MYPQDEKLYSKCISCEDDIMVGQEFIESDFYHYCSTDCYIKLAIKETTINKRVAGDETLRIV